MGDANPVEAYLNSGGDPTRYIDTKIDQDKYPVTDSRFNMEYDNQRVPPFAFNVYLLGFFQDWKAEKMVGGTNY